MIFPDTIPAITMYLQGTDTYYEFPLSGGTTNLTTEYHYSRESISGKKDVKLSGFRIDIDVTINQTLNHAEIRQFWGDLYAESSGVARLYLNAKDSIDNTDNYFDVLVGDFVSRTSYTNTINRHSYDLSFTGQLREVTIATAFVITNDGFYYITNEGDRYIFELDLY